MNRLARYTSVICLSGCALFSSAQQYQGSLTGTCQDETGRPLAAARIVVQGLHIGDGRTTTTDDRGTFRMDALNPGGYFVTVTSPGFASATTTLTVAVSSARDISITMKPAPLQETLQVSAIASSITTQAIDPTTAVHQAVITTHDLQTIPLAARSFANVAYLAPGTEPVEPSDPTKARITAVSSGGSSGLNMESSVDGVDNSDDYIGGFLQNFSPDAIQQFAVRTAQEDADTSRTTGSSVVISTQHGTDQWHGGAAVYVRDSLLNARFPIDNPSPDPKQPFSRQNYVGTLGGPVQREKMWFFSSIEAVHERASIAYSPTSFTEFNALSQLASQGLIPGVPSIPVPHSTPIPFRDYLGLMRLDWAGAKRSYWFLRGAIDNYTTDNSMVQQGSLPSTGATSHNQYLNLAFSNRYEFSPNWLGSFVAGGSGLYLTEARNTHLGFALAFPFTPTSSTTSGLETFGDNQFITPITAFPVLRVQEKYQFRYDVNHASSRHSTSFGLSLIHEPVMSGALAATQETLVSFPQNPSAYLGNAAQFQRDYATGSVTTPAGNGGFSQNVQRLGLYAQDSWRATPRLTVNYGLRWDTTFGLFTASGRSQASNPAVLTLQALEIPLPSGIPHDYRAQFGPRLGFAYSADKSGHTVLRAGFGLFYNDLAQTGWVSALQAVNATPAACTTLGDAGCLPGGANGAVIDPHYKTPYAIHITAGAQHAFSSGWTAAADFTHEQGNHAYRRYQYQAGYTVFSPLVTADQQTQINEVPSFGVYHTDNRSSYNSLVLQLQGNVTKRFNLIANYNFAKAQTWGCVLGELFDYVNGVCDPLHPFSQGDYGPSGEDVRHRLVVTGTVFAPGGFQIASLTQMESARPYTLTTTVPSAALGDGVDNRAVINGQSVSLDSLRGTPYLQADLRISRPFGFHERWSLVPFIEMFNVFNHNNPGANFVTDVGALNVPQDEVQSRNVTDICRNSDCSSRQPITSVNQLRVPAGALGDFFGPGTTVGIPFAAQAGFRLSF